MMEVPRDRLVISIQACIRDLFPVKPTEISFWASLRARLYAQFCMLEMGEFCWHFPFSNAALFTPRWILLRSLDGHWVRFLRNYIKKGPNVKQFFFHLKHFVSRFTDFSAQFYKLDAQKIIQSVKFWIDKWQFSLWDRT